MPINIAKMTTFMLAISIPSLADAANPLHANVTCVSQKNVDHKYNDIRQIMLNTTDDIPTCCSACEAEPECGIWVITGKKCWLKTSYGVPGPNIVYAEGTISMCTVAGAKSCPDYTPPAPTYYICNGSMCVRGSGRVSYTDPNCFGLCGQNETKPNMA
eukprot:m.106983 g.106983  ORF g.106983 m.106983 type:complete len:158 (-) comp27764_c0_seq2:41-514(-)